MKNTETRRIQSISKLISSYAPSLPVDIFNDDPEHEQLDRQYKRKVKPAIPEDAPIEYICLLYRL